MIKPLKKKKRSSEARIPNFQTEFNVKLNVHNINMNPSQMKKYHYFFTALLLFCVFAQLNAEDSRFPFLKGQYFGQKPPGMTPEIFAPGIVSIPGYTEYSGTFSPDGNEYYFYRFSKNSPSKIFFSKFSEREWTAPAPVTFADGYPSLEPHITFDNKTLYFAWERPIPAGDKGMQNIPGIWATTRTADGWSAPKYAGQGMWVSSSRDGRIYITDLLFQSGGHLARVTINNGLFTGYKKLTGGMDALSNMQEMAHPCIAPDGSFLLFDVKGGHYLYVCFKMPDGTWGEAIDLTQHGFDPLAGGAYVSPDGKYLFFHLNGDIWWVDIKIIEELRPKK
jgi:hypothetical protein